MAEIRRDDRGLFVPGAPSPNPSGRPPIDAAVRQELQEIFQAASPRAARRLVELIEDVDPRVSTAAAIHVLDRLLGKVTQSIDATIKTGSVQAAHLAALRELQARTERARREEQGAGGDRPGAPPPRPGDGAKVIDLDVVVVESKGE